MANLHFLLVMTIKDIIMSDIKQDRVGNVLNIGDPVLFMKVNYRYLIEGVVVKMTDKKVRILYTEKGYITRTAEVLQEYCQVVKIIKEN